MKRLAKWALGALVVFFLASGLAHAQAAPPVPAATLFTMSGNYGSFRSGSSTTPVVIASAAVQIANHLSAGYEHISNSSTSSRWELGVLAGTWQLNQLLGSRISNNLKFDASQIGVTFTVGGGKLLQPTVNRIAETAGIHFSYPLADHISVQIFGVDVLHGGVQTGFLTTSTTENLSTGLNIYF